jgi:hypothetical protein
MFEGYYRDGHDDFVRAGFVKFKDEASRVFWAMSKISMVCISCQNALCI